MIMREIPAYPMTFDVKRRPEPGYRVITFSYKFPDGRMHQYAGVLTEDYLDGRRLTVGRLLSDDDMTFKVTGVPREEERLLKECLRMNMRNNEVSIGFFEYRMRTSSEILYEDTAILVANMVDDMCRRGRNGVTIDDILHELSGNEGYRDYADISEFQITKSLEFAIHSGLLKKTSQKGQTRRYSPTR